MNDKILLLIELLALGCKGVDCDECPVYGKGKCMMREGHNPNGLYHELKKKGCYNER